MSDVTILLTAMENGNALAAEQLLPLVYAELRRLAAARISHERTPQTLQATALVHEAFLRLVDTDTIQHWKTRGHFLQPLLKPCAASWLKTRGANYGSNMVVIACGRPPFRAPTAIAVLRRVAEDTPRALQEIVPEIPDWLVMIINKLLAKKPEDRFQTAREVSNLLTRCQSDLQLTGRVTSVALSSSAPGRSSQFQQPHSRRQHSH